MGRADRWLEAVTLLLLLCLLWVCHMGLRAAALEIPPTRAQVMDADVTATGLRTAAR